MTISDRLYYQPPSAAYLGGLIIEMRTAAVKTLEAKKVYEERQNHIVAIVNENWLRQKWMQEQPVHYHVRRAKEEDTPLKDAGIQYEFWKGENMRLAAMIQAEVMARASIMEGQTVDNNPRSGGNPA